MLGTQGTRTFRPGKTGVQNFLRRAVPRTRLFPGWQTSALGRKRTPRGPRPGRMQKPPPPRPGPASCGPGPRAVGPSLSRKRGVMGRTRCPHRFWISCFYKPSDHMCACTHPGRHGPPATSDAAQRNCFSAGISEIGKTRRRELSNVTSSAGGCQHPPPRPGPRLLSPGHPSLLKVPALQGQKDAQHQVTLPEVAPAATPPDWC